MEAKSRKLALTSEQHMNFINNVDEIVLSENPFDHLCKIPAFAMGAYLHIPALGADFSDFPKHLYHRNLPQAAIEEFEQSVVNRLPPCAKSCFANQTFSWLTDIVCAPSTPQPDKDTLRGYLEFNKDGLCMPLYGPHNSNGYVFIGFDQHKSAFAPEMSYQILGLVHLIHIRFRQLAEDRQGRASLTSREQEVLDLICLGKTNPEIGTILNISSNTVSGYVSHIFFKLGVSDRVSAAMRRQSMEIQGYG